MQHFILRPDVEPCLEIKRQSERFFQFLSGLGRARSASREIAHTHQRYEPRRLANPHHLPPSSVMRRPRPVPPKTEPPPRMDTRMMLVHILQLGLRPHYQYTQQTQSAHGSGSAASYRGQTKLKGRYELYVLVACKQLRSSPTLEWQNAQPPVHLVWHLSDLLRNSMPIG